MSSTTLLLIGVAAVAVAGIPLILKTVPPNHIYGFRTPTTLANRELWYRANFFAGWALVAAAIASLVLIVGGIGGVLPGAASGVIAFALPLLVAVIACFIYLRKISGSAAGGSK